MELVELREKFVPKRGNKFDANKMEFIQDGEINFVSRDSKNNGVVGVVNKYKNIEPYPAGLITVSLGGSFLLSSFVQPKKFYTAQNLAILTPRTEMSLNEKIYYCKCISMNRFKYSAFGREANKSLIYLKIPKNVPQWVFEYKPTIGHDIKLPINSEKLSLYNKELKYYNLSQLFTIKKGKRIVVSKGIDVGDCPFISADHKNNGIVNYLNIEPNQSGNTISVSYNGTYVGEAFYQPKPYWATDDVNVLYPNFSLNPFIAMFLITVIRKEKYRYSYGRKWHKERMEKSKIKLPVDAQGNPDYIFMENYIKSLNYSKELSKLI
jgi:hypothetical protein